MTIDGKTIGYVYPHSGKWVAVMEADGQMGRAVGKADNKAAAVNMVTAAYLRT